MINRTVLMTDASNMGIAGINAYEHLDQKPDKRKAAEQLKAVKDALQSAGINIIYRSSPPGEQDGVYTANWAITWKGKALLSRLPNARQGEESYAEKVLRELKFDCRRADETFSGQGDVLIFNDTEALLGHGYRTHLTKKLLKQFEWLGLKPVVIKTKPRRALGFLWRTRNKVTGLNDSYFYDLDLAVAVVAPNVLAVCAEALTRRGRRAIRRLEKRKENPVTVIPVSLAEAKHGLACNLVSTGETVVMTDQAPRLSADLEARGYKVVRLDTSQFRLTGGGIRCVSLTLNSL